MSMTTLENIFEREVAHVFGFVLWRCGSRSVAEEVTGDTFLDASKEAQRNGLDGITRSWLLTVARRRLIDHWRRASSLERRMQVLRTERPRDVEAVDGDPDGLIAAALDSLSPRQRAVLVLRYLDDFSVSEVAEHLELSYRATESLLARARSSFADAYAKELESSGVER